MSPGHRPGPGKRWGQSGQGWWQVLGTEGDGVRHGVEVTDSVSGSRGKKESWRTLGFFWLVLLDGWGHCVQRPEKQGEGKTGSRQTPEREQPGGIRETGSTWPCFAYSPPLATPVLWLTCCPKANLRPCSHITSQHGLPSTPSHPRRALSQDLVAFPIQYRSASPLVLFVQVFLFFPANRTLPSRRYILPQALAFSSTYNGTGWHPILLTGSLT